MFEASCRMAGRLIRLLREGVMYIVPFQNPDGEADGRLPISFNDRGTGKIKGSVNYELAADAVKLEEMYRRYPTQSSLEVSLIEPALKSSIYLTGQLMSSFESYSSRKSELVQYVEDQTQRGVYATRQVSREVADELDPTKKTTVTRAEIMEDNGQRRRTGGGELERYGVRVFNFAIEDLAYDDQVNDQIKAQQTITMAVQTSRAKALEAQQNEITTVSEGRAASAKAKAEQDALNAKIVAEAEGRRLAAEQDKLAAEQERAARILRAQGEAEAARLAVSADNALKLKGDLWLESQKVWAAAFSNYQGAMVPSVVMGGAGGSNAAGNAQTFMEILGAKAAKDLSLDLEMRAPRSAPVAARGAGPGPNATR
jgi:regulator of protease activity HflC (stomatin/prohibitin superfamily)